MNILKFFLSLYFAFALGLPLLQAQSLVADASLSSGSDGNVFSETIKIISSSKKIFIISNNNQQLGPGDFLSLALDNKLAARALVAKVHQGQVGIKILKIYSLKQWGKIKRDIEVQIVKGDDSNFGAAPPPPTETSSKINSEEDLFAGDVVIEDEVSEFDENKNRHIKPDNIVSIFGGFYDAAEVESKGGTVRTNELGISWAYQFSDNIFVEGGYGRALLDNFPGDGTQTLVNHLMARVKYNFKGPIYTFFMPYAGFQSFSVSSPDAGQTTNNVVNEEELAAIDKLKKTGPVFGLTIMRRLVPGWFIKADLGTDLINLGFAIEF
jgi:hypothetical protein